MPTFLRCERAGHDGHNLGFQLIADDGKAYVCTFTPECFTRLFTMGWKAALGLPGPVSTQGHAVGIETTASFAVVDMAPGLVLMSGPLCLVLRLDRAQVTALKEAIDRFTDADPRQTH